MFCAEAFVFYFGVPARALVLRGASAALGTSNQAYADVLGAAAHLRAVVAGHKARAPAILGGRPAVVVAPGNERVAHGNPVTTSAIAHGRALAEGLPAISGGDAVARAIVLRCGARCHAAGPDALAAVGSMAHSGEGCGAGCGFKSGFKKHRARGRRLVVFFGATYRDHYPHYLGHAQLELVGEAGETSEDWAANSLRVRR